MSPMQASSRRSRIACWRAWPASAAIK
jgi:hypothetical protein